MFIRLVFMLFQRLLEMRASLPYTMGEFIICIGEMKMHRRSTIVCI